MRKVPLAVIAALAASMVDVADAASLRPLATEEVETLPAGSAEVILAAGYTRNQRFPHFTPEGAIREQNLIAAPQLELRVAAGDRVEIQASFEMLYLDESVWEPRGDLSRLENRNSYGAGDARLFTKVRALRQQGWRPALGARFGTKLPNADFGDRLGTDEIDFFIDILGSQQFSWGELHANLGLALIGNPGPAIENDTSFDAGGQDDLFTWGFAYVSPELGTLRLLAEVSGNAGSRFDNERAAVRVGAQAELGALTLFLGPSVGLVGGSEDVGVSGGLIYSFEWSSWFGGDSE